MKNSQLIKNQKNPTVTKKKSDSWKRSERRREEEEGEEDGRRPPLFLAIDRREGETRKKTGERERERERQRSDDKAGKESSGRAAERPLLERERERE